MILHFPNLETLHLALLSGVIPEAISLTAARAAFEDPGSVWVQPTVVLPPATLAELCHLGVSVRKTAAVPLDQAVGCWPQLFPLRRDAAAEGCTDRTPVLFELAETQLPELVHEILRLGNDRQSFRRLTDGDAAWVLLRVIGPPYYALLRALDRAEQATAPRAYLERSPRVWVEMGHTHPLVEQVQPPPGKLLLMRPPRHWLLIDEAKFRDIYEVLEFNLPQAPVSWHDTDLGHRLGVPLRLARSGSTEPAELWVLRDRGIEQLESLVGQAEDQLLARLAFAVGTREEQTTVVVRVRPSRLPPPVLVLEGIGFRPYLRLANLFLPCDTRLHPPLRRDAVSKLLAADPGRITWLSPHPDGTFTPESLPDEAFRPLENWVDYLLDREHQALAAWAQAMRFEFESFVCRDEQPARSKKGTDRPSPHANQSRAETAATLEEPVAEPRNLELKARRKKKENALAEPPRRDRPHNLHQRLEHLEKHFLKLESPLDAPERQELWRAMAQLNTALNRAGDATLCWVNALWELPQAASPWLEAWLQAERQQAAHLERTGADLDRLLAGHDPDLSDLRALAAQLACAGLAGQPAPELASRLGRVQQFLERYEEFLPVRAVWLAWLGVAQLARGDLLTLARARDRLLERLYGTGLSADLDLPGFLRFCGTPSGERLRAVRDQLGRLRQTVQQWLAKDALRAPCTGAYADLFFAFGLARLRETTACQQLLEAAQESLSGRDTVHTWLRQAYDYRIRQALEGKAQAGRLPAELLEQLAFMDRLPRFKIDRLREHSRILEPHDKIDPYRRWHGHFQDDLSRELALLADLNDRILLASRLTELLQSRRKWSRVEAPTARILATALELAPRLGEEFARGLLDRIGPVLEALPQPLEQALLLEKGLFVAAHFDQTAQVQGFLGRFHQLFAASDRGTVHALEPLLGQCFRGLRKLGMREEIGRLLERVAGVVLHRPDLQGRLPSLRRLLRHLAGAPRPSSGPERSSSAKVFQLLLQVAGGWLYFGQPERAWPILDEVRAVLFQSDLLPVEQTTLACAYVQALGQVPLERAVLRLEELFRKVERVQDAYTTNTHYALSRLDLVEAAVLALAGQDVGLDPAGRRWLDEDEFLVRRRIHRDLRAALGQ